MPDLQKKPHSVRISVISVSDGVENQELICNEGANTPEELTTKCFTVVDAINDAMKALADSAGYPTGVDGKGRGNAPGRVDR